MNFWIYVKTKADEVDVTFHRSGCLAFKEQGGEDGVNPGGDWHGPYSSLQEAWDKVKLDRPRSEIRFGWGYCAVCIEPRTVPKPPDWA